MRHVTAMTAAAQLAVVGCSGASAPAESSGRAAPSATAVVVPEPAPEAEAANDDAPPPTTRGDEGPCNPTVATCTEPNLRIAASHILIQWRGATRAPPRITRTRAEARALIGQLSNRAKRGDDFATLAKKFSDGPSGPRGGVLGRFGRRTMVKPFSDAAFSLRVGEMSDVVETVFGYHIILRTE